MKCSCGKSVHARGLCKNCYHSFMMKNSVSYYAKYRNKKYRRRTFEKRNSEIYSLDEILEKTGFLCSLCFNCVDVTLTTNHKFSMTIDHIRPLSKGGDSMKYNLLAAHRNCNTRKQDRLKGNSFQQSLNDKLKIQNEKFWKEKLEC